MDKKNTTVNIKKIMHYFSLMTAQENRVKLILFIGILAIAGVLISDNITKPKTEAVSAEPISINSDGSEYAAQLEKRLTEMISSVEGAGNVKVMVTLECGTEYVYASRQKTTSALSEDTDTNGRESRDEKTTGEDNIILIDGEHGEQPLICKEMAPTVAGVVVICSGADDINVKQRIIEIVTTALNTGSNRVCVTLMG